MEPVAFDASRFQGLTALHLTNLMNLTFIGDEKLASNPLFPRPPSPAKANAEADVRGKSVELDSECLEKQLDEEMERTLAEDVATDDHNADKKFGAGTQTDGCDGAVIQSRSLDGIAGTTVKSPLSGTASLSSVPKDNRDCISTVDITSHPTAGL